MKNIIYIITILFIVTSCNEPKKDSRKNTIPNSTKKQLKPLTPKKTVEYLKSNKPIKIDTPNGFETTSKFKINSNNRFEVLIDGKKSYKDILETNTKIALIDNGQIKFSNNWSLSYWVSDYQKFKVSKNEDVNIYFKENFISGTLFKSIKILDKNKLPLLCIISTGDDKPVKSIFNKQITISQSEKERKFVNNESEKINKVVTFFNNKILLSEGKVTEVRIGKRLYQISVNKSIHYYPKGNDSFESPKYILEYTITKVD